MAGSIGCFADEQDVFVARVAAYIAALPDGVIAAAKRAVPYVVPGDGFERESWMGLAFQPAVGQLMIDQLKAGAQTRKGQRDLVCLLRGVTARSA